MAIDASITLVLDMGGHMVRIAKDSPYRLAQDGVKGLEAAENMLTLKQNAQVDGGYIEKEAFQARNITITFVVDDRANTEAHRRLLLRYLNPKQQGTLTVTRSGVTRKIGCKIDGAIEFLQPNIREDRLKVTVNLICPDPWFYEEQATEYEFKNVKPLFTFPFNSLVGVGIMSGLVWRSDELTVENAGDDAMGILLTIQAQGEIRNPKVTLDDGEYIRLLTVLQSGDKAQISTIPKKKDIWINEERALVYDRQSVFFSVPTGKHTLKISADNGVEHAVTKMECSLKYLGV